MSVNHAGGALGIREKFEVLNQARGSMLLLFNMFVTGTGIFLAVWATADGGAIRRTLAIAAIPFMIANLAGFRANLKLQNVLHKMVARETSADATLDELIEALKPYPTARFVAIYLIVCTGLVAIGVALADFQPASAVLPTVSQSKA